jgi:restriction alleviation protein Lar
MATKRRRPVLKPCPFCGKANPTLSETFTLWKVECTNRNCYARANGRTAFRARQNWNRRQRNP